jgi:glycosyltransferase involved in cell wall biosynthesis
MKVLVDTRSFTESAVSAASIDFLLQSFQHLQHLKNEFEFVFLTDQFSKNIVDNTSAASILTIKSTPGKLGWRIWYDWQIPRVVKKNNIDLFISCCAASSSLKIPQCFFRLDIEEKDRSKKTKNYFSFYTSRKKITTAKAEAIYVFSDHSKKNMVVQEKANERKIQVVYPAADENYKPLLWTEKESVKTKFAGGKEYFAVTGIERTENIITVLKAFSQFKKRQQSNMQLLIMGEKLSHNFQLTEKLESFKYRTDVYLHDMDNDKDICDIISASYALISYCHENDPAVTILNAFMADVPVISSRSNSLVELFKDAILYSDLSNYDLLSADMITVYKDENIRSRLIENAKAIVAEFNWQQTCEQLWNGILRATNNR